MTIDVFRTTPADLRRKALAEGQPGRIAVGNARGEQWRGKWSESATFKAKNGKRYDNPELIRRENAMIPALVRQLHEGLPPIVRTSPRQKYETLVGHLADYALDSIRKTGQVHWPASIERELRTLGWKDGDPRLESIGTLEGAKKQIADLAHKWTPEFANKQRAKDRKKTALDWHGHYSA